MKNILLITLGLSAFLWADFTRDNSTAVVTDNKTTLQWQDDVSTTGNWEDAIAYCEVLNLNGTGWRLPNFNELYYIADRSKSGPSMDVAFQNVVSSLYWSSTTANSLPGWAWSVNFNDGGDGWDSKGSNLNVRCVRGGL